MISRTTTSRRGAGRLVALTLVATLLLTIVASGGLGASLGLIDGSGDETIPTHTGIAAAQSDEGEGDSGGGGIGVTADSESEADTDSDDEDDEDEEDEEPTAAEEAESERRDLVDSNTAEDPETEADAAAAAAEDERRDLVDSNTPDTEPTQAEEDAAAADDQRRDLIEENGGTDGRDDDDDGGIGFVAQRMLEMIEGLTVQMSNEFGSLVAQMFELASTRSAPGVADDPATWENPDDPMWSGALDVMELTRFMGIFITIGGLIFSLVTFYSAPRAAKERLKWCVIAIIFLSKPAFWIGLSLHVSNTISSTILPGAEAFSTPEGVLLVGLAVIAAGLLASASLWIIALATFVTVIAHSAGFVTAMFLPLAVSLYIMPMYLRSLGEMMVYLHGVTIFMPIFQALATLAVIRMALAESGVLGSITGVVMFLGVIYLVYYLFQKEVLEKAFDAPITSLGVHGAQIGVEGAQNAKTTITNAPEMFRDMRTSIEANIESVRSRFHGSDGIGYSRPSIGAVQAPAASRQSAAVTDGGSDRRTSRSSTGSDGIDAREIDVRKNRERDRLSRGYY